MNKRKWMVMLVLQLFWGINQITVQGMSDGPDALWLKAVELAAQNRSWIPGEARIFMEEIDSSGKVNKTEESWVRYFLSAKGVVDMELIKQVKNGREVTADKPKKTTESKQKTGKEQKVTASLSDFNPFEPGKQKNIRVIRRNIAKMVDNQKCNSYEYRLKQDDGKMQVGMAWLNEAGTPVELEYTLEPLPRFVSRMTYKVHYQFQPDGSWYPVELHVEAAGKAFFKTFHIRNRSVFGDFWRYNPKKRSNEE